MNQGSPIDHALDTIPDDRDKIVAIFGKIARSEAGSDDERELLRNFIDRIIIANRLISKMHSSSDTLRDSLNPQCYRMVGRINLFLGCNLFDLCLHDKSGSYSGVRALVRITAFMHLAFDLNVRFPQQVIPSRAYETRMVS